MDQVPDMSDSNNPQVHFPPEQAREQAALVAYLNFLKQHGALPGQLEKRQLMLNALCTHLSGIEVSGQAYREAVDNWLETVEKSKWPSCLAMVREYFPFWTQNVKEIARLASEADGIDLEQAQWQSLEGDFSVIWRQMEQTRLSQQEMAYLDNYRHALQMAYLDEKLVDTRVKLAKLLLVRLKNTSNRIPRVYRKAVDATVPVFQLKEMRWLFIEVVREFFYFWKQS